MLFSPFRVTPWEAGVQTGEASGGGGRRRTQVRAEHGQQEVRALGCCSLPRPVLPLLRQPGPGPSASVALRAEAVKVHTLLGSCGQPEGPRV